MARKINEIAVVISCYNKAEHIKRSIASALSQTKYVIVVDDCSNDGSEKILNSSEGYILIRHEFNKGATCANISGISYAKELGIDFVATLDGDDILAPNALEYYWSKLQDSGADGIVANSLPMTSKKNAGQPIPCDQHAAVQVLNAPLAYWLRNPFGGMNMCGRANHLIASVNPDLRIQDVQMTFSLFHNSQIILVSDAVTYYYQYADSANNLSKDRVNKIISFTQLFYYINSLNIDEEFRNNLIDRSFYSSLSARFLYGRIGIFYSLSLFARRFLAPFFTAQQKEDVIRAVLERLTHLKQSDLSSADAFQSSLDRSRFLR